tara:strand:- start:437 stop:649 length:213 start_codon:yes stop_codon:yes gene_type:complete
MKKIIYPNENGFIIVLNPTGQLSLEETAKKDVPTGVKYKIINASDLPSDYEFLNAWEYDFDKNGHDGVGA